MFSIENTKISSVALIFSNIFSALSFICIKKAVGIFSLFSLLTSRFLLGILFLSLLAMVFNINLTWNQSKLLILRAFAGILSFSMYLLAISIASIGEVALIYQCSILWSYFLSRRYLSEKTHAITKVAVCFALVGFGMVLNIDDLIFQKEWKLNPAHLYSLLGSFSFSIVVLTTKIVRETNNGFSLIFSYFAVASVVMAIASPFFSTISLEGISFFKNFFLIVGMVTFSLLSNLLLAAYSKHLKVFIAATLNISSVPTMYILGWLFFKEVLSIKALIGAGVILTSLFVVVVYE